MDRGPFWDEHQFGSDDRHNSFWICKWMVKGDWWDILEKLWLLLIICYLFKVLIANAGTVGFGGTNWKCQHRSIWTHHHRLSSDKNSYLMHNIIRSWWVIRNGSELNLRCMPGIYNRDTLASPWINCVYGFFFLYKRKENPFSYLFFRKFNHQIESKKKKRKVQSSKKPTDRNEKCIQH